MGFELVASIFLFALVTVAAPGLNNMMTLAFSVNHGFGKTLPFILGVVVGWGFMNLCFALGLGQLFLAYPEISVYLKVIACIYIVYLARQIASSKTLGKDKTGEKARPLNFIEAVLIQWVNPKAYALSVSFATLYIVPEELILSTLAIVLTVMGVHICCQFTWAAFGVVLRKFLTDPKRLRIFNSCMGALLLLAIVPIIFI